MNINELVDKTFILNPNYVLLNDKTRSVIATANTLSFLPKPIELDVEDVVSLIHPMYAMLLSFFDGESKLKNVLKNIEQYFRIDSNASYDIVSKLINNPSDLGVEYDGNFFYLPKYLIIENKDFNSTLKRKYSPHDFEIQGEVNLTDKRLNKPIYASLLINNKCKTDCIYCYADKRHIYECTIPFERIKELILEAKQIGITAFDIQGGELFLYPEWDKLLKNLYNAGYYVYISTKCPITETDIERLVATGTKEMQISLDSIYQNDLSTNLRVQPNYKNNILTTITNICKTDISIKLKAVITNTIFNINDIKDYLNYFDQYKNIKVIEFTAPAHSLYKSQQEFFNYRLHEWQVLQIIKLVKDEQNKHHYKLNVDIPRKEDLYTADKNLRAKKFSQRSNCSGNMGTSKNSKI